MGHNWTGERLETFVYSRDAIEHLHRYALAKKYVNNKVVLDIASGEGYGSNLLCANAKHVYGVDIEEKVIERAKKKYKKNNLEFVSGSAFNIPLKDNLIDVVVSFETIEHHDKHDEMMSEIKRVLKDDGILIMSTPDKKFYTDERNFHNKFHVKELYKNEFINLILKNFKIIQILTQKYINGISIIQENEYSDEFIFFSGKYDEIKNVEIMPLFLIVVASNIQFNKHENSVFDGNHIITTLIERKIYLSNSYRLGHFILSPFKFLKKKFK